MPYTILGSLDFDRFREILSETASYDDKERLQGHGPLNKMMYSLMETHFKQKGRTPSHPRAKNDALLHGGKQLQAKGRGRTAPPAEQSRTLRGRRAGELQFRLAPVLMQAGTID
jgi:hypothetical protein